MIIDIETTPPYSVRQQTVSINLLLVFEFESFSVAREPCRHFSHRAEGLAPSAKARWRFGGLAAYLAPDRPDRATETRASTRKVLIAQAQHCCCRGALAKAQYIDKWLAPQNRSYLKRTHMCSSCRQRLFAPHHQLCLHEKQKDIPVRSPVRTIFISKYDCSQVMVHRLTNQYTETDSRPILYSSLQQQNDNM